MINAIYDRYSFAFPNTDENEVEKFAAECALRIADNDTEWVQKTAAELTVLAAGDEAVVDRLYAVLDNIAAIGSQVEKMAAEVLAAAGPGTVMEKVSGVSARIDSILQKQDERISELTRQVQESGSQKKEQKSSVTPWLLGGAALASVVGPVLVGAYQKRQNHERAQQTLHTVLRTNQHLRNDPNILLYHNTIANFAPHIAQDPVLLQNILNHVHTLGPTALSTGMVKELVDIGEKHQKINAGASPLTAARDSLDVVQKMRGVVPGLK